jgi:hypothetical protein
MKHQCDKCGFKSMHSEVFRVFHVDADLDNCRHANLKTVCANCQIELIDLKLPWKPAAIVPDF